MPYLALKNPDGSVNEFWNLHEGPTTVGRGTESNAKVDDGQLSRQHFTVTKSPDGFVLKDLGSKNGTRVNGQPVTGEVTLKPNDLIQAGQSKFSFLEGLTTMSMKIEQDLKDLDKIAHPPGNPPPA